MRPTSTTLLNDRTVDAIVIATPPQTHYPIAKAALEAGKHVLVEKPLATSLADAYELAEIAEDARTACSCRATPSSTARPSTRCAT